MFSYAGSGRNSFLKPLFLKGNFLHEIRQPKLLLLLLAEGGRNGKFEYLDTLFGVSRYLLFPAYLPGHLKIFLHRALMDGWDDVTVTDTFALKLRAFTGQFALGAGELQALSMRLTASKYARICLNFMGLFRWKQHKFS